jgi:hypothetical protein
MRPTQEHNQQEQGKQGPPGNQKVVSIKRAIIQAQVKKRNYGAVTGKQPHGTVRRSAPFFLLTRFIDGLQLRRAITIQAAK